MAPPRYSEYRWARLYIKSVRFLAFLCLLIGATLSVATIWKGSVAYRRTVYTPNPAIGSGLEAVRAQYRTASELLGLKGIPTGDNTANKSSLVGRTPRNSLQLQAVETFLNEIWRDVKTIQDNYYAAFSRPVESLIEILSEHSRQVRSKLSPTNKVSVTSGEDIDKSARPTQTPKSSRMYGAVSQNEIKQLSSVRRELSYYQSQTTKVTTRSCMADAIKALEMYTEVLESELPEPTATPSERRNVETQMPSEPRVELRVDDLIRSLQQHKAVVRSVVLTDWQVENTIEDLLNLVHNEIVKSRDCELAGQEQMIETGIFFAGVICLALLVAFLAMVLADFLQAIIDTPDLIRSGNADAHE